MPIKSISTICLILAIFYHVQPVMAEEIATTTPESVVVETPAVLQPQIRVLLKVIKNESGVTVAPGTTLVVDTITSTIDESAEIAMRLQAGKIVVTKDGVVVGSGVAAQIVPNDPEEISKITNFSRPVKGHKSVYNVYRGSIAWRVSKDKKSIAVINELPLEEYLWGLTETAPKDPADFVQALVVAARSYAYVRLHNTRLPYDVEATTNDQLYLGYESELRLPEVRVAAEATIGEVVTYKNNPVTTPYFSRTNGSTIDWDKNHKDSRPWLQAVEAQYDKGGKRSGHGYGMSLHDAKLRVVNDSWTYKDVLGYYYSGVEIKSLY